VSKPRVWLRLNYSQTSGSFVPKQVVFLGFVNKPVPPKITLLTVVSVNVLPVLVSFTFLVFT
jgi:hypothetical protein